MIESLLEIKNAEEKAALLVERAKTDMERMVQEAENKRDAIFSDTTKQYTAEIKKIRDAYVKEGEDEAKDILDKSERELEFIKKQSKANFSKAVDAAVKSVI